MAGYPKIHNIEMDPHEDLQVGALFGWAASPALEVVEKYKEALKNISEPARGQPDALLTYASARGALEPDAVAYRCFRNVCYWHKADILNALTNVRFRGQRGSDADIDESLFVTPRRHWPPCLA